MLRQICAELSGQLNCQLNGNISKWISIRIAEVSQMDLQKDPLKDFSLVHLSCRHVPLPYDCSRMNEALPSPSQPESKIHRPQNTLMSKT